MIQEYTQSTFESCLAVDLLNLTETKISPKKERKVLDYALDYSKYHFTLGHLDFVVIVYLDAFVIWKITHAPHFIIVIENSRKGYKIYDPWDGKIRLINSTVLSKAIISLRNLLKYCPQLIQKK